MKVRSLKQVLHWLFLIVGIICVIVLALSVNTYISYAKEGYGLEVEVDQANVVDDDYYWLRLRLYITNPGSLDVILEGGSLVLSGNTYNLTATDTPGGIQDIPISDLTKNDNTSVVLWFIITESDYNQIASDGQADIHLDLEISVPDRHMTTRLVFEDTIEVSL